MYPQELVGLPQWVVVRVVVRPGMTKDVMPHNPRTMGSASPTDSRTWGTYEEACAAALKHKLYHGFMLDGFIGIDLDKTDDPAELANQLNIYNSVVSYTERSLSGNGVHIICRGSIPHAVKRNHVEIYGRARLFIMTGDHVAGRPTTIEDCNAVVNAIVEQAGAGRVEVLLYDEAETRPDADVYAQCISSANGEKFKPLWDGHWEGNYGSQSEADFALINMLAFATHNNGQTRRMFRQSGLGQRQKAQRDDYLDSMIGRIRAEQHPPVDFSNFKAPPLLLPPTKIQTDYTFPQGLIGELAQYIHDSAIKPIPQIALAGALGLISGIAGRTYNISNTGLNLYFLLIAGTAVGKEGASQGMDRIINAVSRKLPAVQQFIGPSEFASGQALVKQLEETPCMVSKMGEFGHMLKRICNPNAIGADVMWRKLFLELFNKSGPTDKLGKMVYSDQGKNTAEVSSPAFSIVADSTASSVFENLSEETIEIGLIPRFMVIECADKRPPTNPNAWAPPPTELIIKMERLAIRCLSMSANGTRQTIGITEDAWTLVHAFDKEIDGHINAQNDDAVRQIWSRSYLKALRVAGVLAVGMNVDAPTVTLVEAKWAIQFAREDAQNMMRRFGDGVGGGDPEQVARLRNAITLVLHSKQTSKKMKDAGVFSHQAISQRAYKLACFKADRMGAGSALNRALNALLDNGEILPLPKKDVLEHFGFHGKSYCITNSFQGVQRVVPL